MSVYSLRRLLTLQSLAAIVVPFIVVVLLGLFWVVPQVMKEVESQQIQLGRAIVAQVERYLETSATVIRADAAITVGRDMPLHLFQEMLDAQLAATESLGSLYAVKPDGRTLTVGLDRHHQARRQDFLNLDFSRNPLFLDVKKHGNPQWSQVFLSVIHGGLSVAFAMPGNGIVVIGEIDLKRLTAFLKNISSESDLRILIVDHNGQVIADQDGRHTAQQLNIANIPLVQRSLDSHAVNNGRLDFEGTSMIGNIQRISSVKWHVLVAQPIASLYRPLINSALVVIAAFVLAIFFGVAISIKLSQKMASRFDKLIGHSRDIAAGTGGGDWPSSNIAEFNQLSGSLHSMSVTLQQQAAGLRESEQHYHDLFNKANEGLFIMTRGGQLSDVNQAFAEMHGYTVDELKNTDIRELDVLKDRSLEDRADIIHRIQAGEVVRFEVEHYHKDGHTFPLSVTSSMIRLGSQMYYLAFHQDITDRKRIDAEHRILEERLQRAEKMEALGQLAGGVAHDLNNVLGVIVGYSEMILAQMDKSSPFRHGLENVMSGGLKAAAIVEDLLTLARRGVQGRSILNLNQIVSDCRKSPEFDHLSSHHRSVKIITDLEPDLLNISGSSVHLGKTLYNLISNAGEAMTKGGTVTIKTTNQYLDRPIHGYDQIREGNYAVLSVSDVGEGISFHDLKRIFEPFYTKKIMGRSGTGLGLAVVWGTVRDHNGYINVQSEEGKGSTFTLYFPVTREEIPTETAAVPISEYIGKGESILVVDDVKEQRDLAESLLSSLTYNVAIVSSGEEAIEYVKGHAIDLMVLDMIMDPGIDGLDAYKGILDICPNQKVIIVSGFSESDRVKAARDLGAGAYVKKPYIKEKLGLAVRKELDRK